MRKLSTDAATSVLAMIIATAVPGAHALAQETTPLKKTQA
jgi:hypothetical protein